MARGKSVRLLASIPQQYSPDFMDRLDKRTVLGRAVTDRYESTVADLGGRETLSTIKHSLVRRFVWFEAMLEGMECRAAAGEEIDVGSWTQLTNTWLGIARTLGLDRQAKPMGRLYDAIYRPAAPTEDPERTEGQEERPDATDGTVSENAGDSPPESTPSAESAVAP